MEKDLEDNVRFRIVGQLLAAEVAKGHLKWKVSEVARKLKVSRGVIYYHFGKTKQEILDTCYGFIAEHFYGLSGDRSVNGVDDLEKSLWRILNLYLEHPSIAIFFHRWRLQDSSFQRKILKLETQYHDRLHKLFPMLDHDEILALHSIFHGAATSPWGTEKSTRIVAQIAGRFLESKAKG